MRIVENEVMSDKMDEMLDHMIENYNSWSRAGKSGSDEIKREMEKDYADGLVYEYGSKYIKVISGKRGSSSVCAFVVNTDRDKKFRFGDILKPAGWSAPARNFARGNVFEENGFNCVRWTGAY